jgi:hypothetical protein
MAPPLPLGLDARPASAHLRGLSPPARRLRTKLAALLLGSQPKTLTRRRSGASIHGGNRTHTRRFCWASHQLDPPSSTECAWTTSYYTDAPETPPQIRGND